MSDCENAKASKKRTLKKLMALNYARLIGLFGFALYGVFIPFDEPKDSRTSTVFSRVVHVMEDYRYTIVIVLFGALLTLFWSKKVILLINMIGHLLMGFPLHFVCLMPFFSNHYVSAWPIFVAVVSIMLWLETLLVMAVAWKDVVHNRSTEII